MKMGSVIVENGKTVLTMAEYIEREAFERALVEVYQGLGGYKTRDAFYKAIDIAHSFPKSDVAPVRHGKWIHTDLAAHWYGKDECNECKYHEHDRRDLSHFNFCPNCGAKMDLEE